MFTLNGNPKSRYRSLSSFNGCLSNDSFSNSGYGYGYLTTLFEFVYTPPNLLEKDIFSRDMKISDSMINITPRRLKFSSVDISSRIPFEFQTLEINCYSYNYNNKKHYQLSMIILIRLKQKL